MKKRNFGLRKLIKKERKGIGKRPIKKKLEMVCRHSNLWRHFRYWIKIFAINR